MWERPGIWSLTQQVGESLPVTKMALIRVYAPAGIPRRSLSGAWQLREAFEQFFCGGSDGRVDCSFFDIPGRVLVSSDMFLAPSSPAL